MAITDNPKYENGVQYALTEEVSSIKREYEYNERGEISKIKIGKNITTLEYERYESGYVKKVTETSSGSTLVKEYDERGNEIRYAVTGTGTLFDYTTEAFYDSKNFCIKTVLYSADGGKTVSEISDNDATRVSNVTVYDAQENVVEKKIVTTYRGDNGYYIDNVEITFQSN